MPKLIHFLTDNGSGSAGAYRRGLLLVLFCATLWSFSGLIFRFIDDAGDWTLIFYRSLGVILGTLAAVLVTHGRRAGRAFRAIGKAGVAAAVCLAAASLCFLIAIHHTTIANISFMLAAHPFFAAGLAWVLMGERVAGRTWLAAALALIGVAIMVLEGLAAGGALGNLLALAAALLSGGYAVALRMGRGPDMTPAVTLAGLIALGVSVMQVEQFAIPLDDLLLCLLQGAVISAICNSVFALAARHVPAAELTLLALLETVLAPLWVFLVIDEQPTLFTLFGGAVIFAAIAGHAVSSFRQPQLTTS